MPPRHRLDGDTGDRDSDRQSPSQAGERDLDQLDGVVASGHHPGQRHGNRLGDGRHVTLGFDLAPDDAVMSDVAAQAIGFRRPTSSVEGSTSDAGATS